MKTKIAVFWGTLIRAFGLFICIIILLATALIVLALKNDANIYHNKGSIKISINGENVDLENAVITSDWKTQSKIHNGRFKFIYGHYGYNKFTLVIPMQCFKEYGKDVILTFGSFHVDNEETNDYKLNVALEENDGKLTGECSRTDIYDKSDGSESSRTESITVNLDENNNVIDFVTDSQS